MCRPASISIGADGAAVRGRERERNKAGWTTYRGPWPWSVATPEGPVTSGADGEGDATGAVCRLRPGAVGPTTLQLFRPVRGFCPSAPRCLRGTRAGTSSRSLPSKSPAVARRQEPKVRDGRATDGACLRHGGHWGGWVGIQSHWADAPGKERPLAGATPERQTHNMERSDSRGRGALPA